MPEPCTHQHQRAVAVRKAAYDSGTPPDLTVDPLDTVVGANTQTVLGRMPDGTPR